MVEGGETLAGGGESQGAPLYETQDSEGRKGREREEGRELGEERERKRGVPSVVSIMHTFACSRFLITFSRRGA